MLSKRKCQTPGFMTNPTEDRQLNSASYQKKLAKGIANGVDRYFGK